MQLVAINPSFGRGHEFSSQRTAPGLVGDRLAQPGHGWADPAGTDALLWSRTSASFNTTTDGKPVPDLGDGRTDWSKPTVLLFVTSDCEVCKPRLSELASIAEVEGDKVGFGVVFTGSANGLKPDGVRVFERQQAVVAQFGMQATPFGAAIRPDGLISDVQPVGSSQAIQELVQAARGEAWQ
jgi:hypothetical protein